MTVVRKTPLGGTLGVRTAALYKLNKAGTQPIEKIGDLIPPLERLTRANKVVLDMIDSEAWELSFETTENPLQDFTAAQSNVHQLPERLTIVGTLVSSIDLAGLTSVGISGIPAAGIPGLRADLQRLEALADLGRAREPIMIVTPRHALMRAWIKGISDPWTPETAENTVVTIQLQEARIVSPLAAEQAIQDIAQMTTGNNRADGVGAKAPIEIIPANISDPTVFGLAPVIG